MTKAPKKKGRPKSSKNKTKVVETKFATVIKDMKSDQRKVLDQLLFSATEPSVNPSLPESVLSPPRGRQLPQNNIKKDHLLIKGIKINKNMTSGEWEVSLVETNKGNFGTGQEQTKRIDQKQVRALVSHLKNVFEEDLKAFLEEENDNK